MAASAALNALPLEIISGITSHLEALDCHNLRLVASRLAHQLFPEMPREKTFNAASKADLRLLIAMTEPGQPGCLIESLTLLETLGEGVPDGDLEAEADRPREGAAELEVSLDPQGCVELLAQAFNNLSKHSKSGSLSRLVLQTGSWQRMLEHGYRWQYDPVHSTKTSGALQRRVLLALHASPLPITVLEIIGANWERSLIDKQDIERNRFVFGCDGLASVIANVDLEPSLRDLKEFSIKFSASSRPIDDAKPGGNVERKDWGPHTTKRDYSPLLSIIDLLRLCPNLESLGLKGYDTWGLGKISLLQRIVDSCPLSSLKTCSLAGFGTHKGELLSFLRQHSALQSLSKKAVCETDAQWTEIFEHIATKMPELQYLHLDNLWAINRNDDGGNEDGDEDTRYRGHLCWFEAKGKGYRHYAHSTMRGFNCITREAEQIREPIVKKPFQAGRVQTRQVYSRWREGLAANYGSYPVRPVRR